MDFLYDYLAFLAKAVTIVVSIVIVVGAIAAIGARRQSRHPPGHIEIERMNDRLTELRHAIDQTVMPRTKYKKAAKQEAKARKEADKESAKTDEDRRRLWVLDFKGDLQGSHVDNLRQEITAVLLAATERDEVLVKVESAGGLVHAYGLAASQLARVKEAGVRLTAAVDRVAASGGYMMAAVADRIIAAPFALVGSIGVVAQVPNVHRLLKKLDVDFDVLTAGEYKRTLTVFGQNTEEGRKKFMEELEDTHALFQEFVSANRASVDIKSVATGEAWYGDRAKNINLVDDLSTSDQYIMNACEDADVFEVKWISTKKPIERIMDQLGGALTAVVNRVAGGLR